jgi:CheY-like chemotaxis protein
MPSGLRSITPHIPAPDAHNAQHEDAAMTQGRLLVADDEAAIRESLSEVLREEGYEVTEAPDGAAAIAAVQSREFDLVIADLRMPGADGIEVLRRTRELAPQTLVILVTAYATLETAVEALRQGAHDYIIKPLIQATRLGGPGAAPRSGIPLRLRESRWQEQGHVGNCHAHPEGGAD